MYENPTNAEVQEAMQTLRDRGIATVKIHFSGGNDEGGADDFEFLDDEGKKIEGPGYSDAHERKHWDGSKMVSDGWFVYEYDLSKEYKVRYIRPATDAEIALAKVARVIEYPIYDCYGSFAGEFEVCGTLTWDVTKGTHEMHGNESYTSWKSF